MIFIVTVHGLIPGMWKEKLAAVTSPGCMKVVLLAVKDSASHSAPSLYRPIRHAHPHFFLIFLEYTYLQIDQIQKYM